MADQAVPVRLVREALRAQLPLVERHTVSNAWAVNTYTACDIRCSYCITRAQGISRPRHPASEIAGQLRRELDAAGTIDRLVVGCYADVYPSPEAELRVTRAALEVIAERGYDFRLVTKGTCVVRDADLFMHPLSLIQVSVSMLDDDHVARLEPGADSPASRLAALHQLHALGVRVVLQISPWIPGVSDVAALLERVDPAIRVQVTPLRLPATLDRARRALRLTQREVNEAYRREYERVGTRRNVWWARPPTLEGDPPYIKDNIGRHEIEDWTPAPPAPDPGPVRW